jgi:hypothetical protein
MTTHIHETATPTDADARVARDALRRPGEISDAGQSDLSIRIQSDEESGTEIRLPFSAFRLLKDILAEMAEGHAFVGWGQSLARVVQITTRLRPSCLAR